MGKANKNEQKILYSLSELINVGKYKRAMQLASLAIRSHPSNPKIYALFLSALRQSGHEKKALTFAISALRNNPNSLELNVEYLLVLYQMREYERFRTHATELCEQLSKLPPINLRNPILQKILNQLATSALTVPHFPPTALETLHRGGSGSSEAPSKRIQPIIKPGEIIKIGIFSSQVCNHVVARFFSGFAAQIANYPWEVTLYFDVSSRKEHVRLETAQQMKNFGIKFKEINIDKNSSNAKKIIKKDKLHLILELAGRFDGSYRRLLNDRLAPIQASWIGYPCHPGFPAIDYFLTDGFCQPISPRPETESKIYRFNRFFSSFDPSHLQEITLDSPSQSNNPYKRIRFTSLNHSRKLNQYTLHLWARILYEVPDSTLIFKSNSITAYQEEWIMDRFKKLDIDPHRIEIIRKKDTPKEHLNHLQNVDIALDTFPYSGTTTTCDTLYMGLPTITLLGDEHVSRVTGAILTAVGCPELIAKDEDEFVRIAVSLAQDRARLSRYRQSLRDSFLNSELCDSAGMAQAMQEFIEDVLYDGPSSAQHDKH